MEAISGASLTAGVGQPSWYTSEPSRIRLCPVPDSAGVVHVRYFLSLDLLEESSAIFKRILQQWRSLWVQGCTVKTMQRFDDERYPVEMQIYNGMLQPLETQAARVGIMTRHTI